MSVQSGNQSGTNKKAHASDPVPSGSHNDNAGLANDSLISSVLFVCTMNAIRSPLAEHILKARHASRIYCDSAGTEAGELDGFAIAIAKKHGLDINSHVSKTIEELEDSFFDLIVTLSPQAHHRVLDLTSDLAVEVEYWPTMDPSTVAGSRDQIMDAYEKLYQALEEKVHQRFK